MNKIRIDNKSILEKHADEIRKQVITMAYNARSAHTGGALSCVDLLTALYFSVMEIDPEKPLSHNQDRFIFSKAHDCKALYAVLAQRGYFDKKILLTYEQNGG